MSRFASFRRSVVPVPLALAALLGAGGDASAQLQVGSFVSGERRMYLEMSPLVEGQNVHIELRNLPAGARGPLLLVSFGVNPIDVTPFGIPGALGPDLATFALIDMNPTTFSYDAVIPPGLLDGPLYFQGYVKVKGGGRLSSMVTAHVIQPGDDPGTDPSVNFPLPLTTEEVLPPHASGTDRTQQPVRVGLPLPRGEVVENAAGVPKLTILGGVNEAQFSTLATWPDGSVKWALCEYLVDLPAGTASTAFSVDKGAGNFGGTGIATVTGTVTTLNTGPLKVKFDSATPALFDSFQLNGREVFDLAKGNQPHYHDESDVEWTWHETSVEIRRNGPVRGEVEVNGIFTRSTSATDPDRIIARFYVDAFKGGASVRLLSSLRATSVQFPEHLLFRGFTWRAFLKDAGAYDVRMPQTTTDGYPPGLWTGKLSNSSQDASFYQGFARTNSIELCYDPNWSNYVPYVERFGDDDFAIEGVRARIDSTHFTGDSSSNWWSPQNEFADPTFVEVNAANGHGVIVGLEHANLNWPIELQAGGDGRIEVGLLPRKDAADPHDYGLTYASAETRGFWIVAEDAESPDPIAEAIQFDQPVGARANPWVYNQANVWHWRLVGKPEVDAYVALAGLKTPVPSPTDLVRTIYEYSNATGGASNTWEETRRFYQWIRGGLGGAYLNSWYEALYKVDKMPWSIDDDTVSNRQKVRNTLAPVTKKDDYYNNSKHTFVQAVADWGFAHGETYLLDSARSFRETLLDPLISANVQPHGNFVAGTFGAVVTSAVSVLDMEPDQQLEDWVHEVCFQWSNIVFKVDNSFGVDTDTRGWQAPLGTPPGTAANPDAYMISWDAGKSSDKALYGYTTQGWTDVRLGALAFQRYVHHLREVDPTDPLIDDLLDRAPDWLNYARRSIPDDYTGTTGDEFMIDVFEGDANDPDPDPFADPGLDTDFPDPSGYVLHNIVNFALEAGLTETALSYGVEMHRSISKNLYDQMINEPLLNEFIWRYLVHYGALKP